MSHANIYRHFPGKKALLDAVAARWLHAVSDPLRAIAADRARPATERLAAWFHALRAAKRGKVRDDPELFQVYQGITGNAREVVGAHVTGLLAQLELILTNGIASGAFKADGLDAPAAARAFLQAAAQFHHPAMVAQKPPPTEADARVVLGLLLAGLRR